MSISVASIESAQAAFAQEEYYPQVQTQETMTTNGKWKIAYVLCIADGLEGISTATLLLLNLPPYPRTIEAITEGLKVSTALGLGAGAAAVLSAIGFWGLRKSLQR